jgi:hypothetical protein
MTQQWDSLRALVHMIATEATMHLWCKDLRTDNRLGNNQAAIKHLIDRLEA